MTTGSFQPVRNPIADAAQDQEQHADDLGHADRHVAGGDRPEPLLRVEAVGLDVERVVQEVGAAGREAEGDERDRRCRRSPGPRPSTPAAAGAATTRTFLTHCFGRASAISAVTRDRRRVRRRARLRRARRPGPAGSRRRRPCEDWFLPGERTRQCYCLGPPGTRPPDVRPRSRDSRRGPAEDALGHRRRLGRDAPLEHVGAGAVHRRCRRVRRARRARRDGRRGGGRRRRPARRPGPASLSAPPASVGELAGERGVGRGLEVRGVAVVPAAEEPPDVAHDELGLVVDRAEVRLGEQLGRRGDRVHDVVEARALVHHPERLDVQVLEQRGGVGERGADAVGADDRQAVARAAAPRRRARPSSRSARGPLDRVALHLLRVAAVRRRPDEEVAGAEHLAVGRPHPGVVVGLAAGVVQLEALAADVEVEPVAVRLVGVAVLGRPERLLRAELPLVDDRRCTRRSRRSGRSGPAIASCATTRGGCQPLLARFGLVELDAEAVVDVAVGEDRGVEPVAAPAAQRRRAPCRRGTGCSCRRRRARRRCANAAAFANAATNAVVGEISASSPNWLNGWCSAGSSSPVKSRSAVSRTSVMPVSQPVGGARTAARSQRRPLPAVSRCGPATGRSTGMETCSHLAVTQRRSARGRRAGPQPGGAAASGCSTRRSRWPTRAGSTRCRCATSRPRPASRSAPSTGTSRARSACCSRRTSARSRRSAPGSMSHPPTGATPADRVVDVLRRACTRARASDPEVTAAMVRALGLGAAERGRRRAAGSARR